MALSSTSFKSPTPLQDRACELGMDIILKCDDTLKLNQMLMDYNKELDELRAKRHTLIYNLHQITHREVDIDKLQDAVHDRIQQLELSKKQDAKEINQVNEQTKRIMKSYVFKNCTVNIE